MNPSRPQRISLLREAAATAAKRAGAQSRFGDVDRLHPDSMRRLVTQAFEEGCQRLVAVGGDGTFNHLLQLLAEMGRLDKTEVGFVPAGTCNDFVRTWRLNPRRTREAFRVACEGQRRWLDLGDMNGRLFLNNAGFGRRTAATVVRRGRPRRSGALKTLRAFEPIAMRVAWDKGSIEGRFFMGLVCNGFYFSRGLHFAAPRIPDDGLLDVFLVPAMPKAKLAAMLLWGRLGRPIRSRELLSLRVPRLQIETSEDLWPQVDGEPPDAEPVHTLRFAISPLKAQVMCPS